MCATSSKGRQKREKQADAKTKREAAKAEKQRQERMAEIKSAPDTWLKKAPKLVEERGTDSYRESASVLADLRDASSSQQGNKITRQHAAHLY